MFRDRLRADRPHAMTEQELSKLSDEELRAEAKKMKSSEWQHALLIGVMIGVVLYSIANNAIGLATLIPLWLISRVLHKPERNAALKKVLKERGLEPGARP